MNLFRQPNRPASGPRPGRTSDIARAVAAVAIVVFVSSIAALQLWTDIRDPASGASAATARSGAGDGGTTMPAAADVVPEHDQELLRFSTYGG